MIDFVRVNNTRYGWNSTRHLVDGGPQEGLVAVDYEEKRERKVVYGNRQDGTPLGWTSGKYSIPSMKVKYLEEYSAIFEAGLAAGGLIAPGLGSYGDAEWTFFLQSIEPAIGSVPITIVASPCTVVGRRASREEGVDELLVEYDILCLSMIRNGIALWSFVRAALSA